MTRFNTLPARYRRASLALALICVFTLGAFIDRLAQPEPAALAAAHAAAKAGRPSQPT